MTRHHHSSSPFYDREFAERRMKKGRLVPDAKDELCTSCHLPPPTEWCWQHNPSCPLQMSLRGTAAITVRCAFGMFNAPPQPGTMTFTHGSNFALFVSDDGKTRSHVRLDLLSANFGYPT